jgi:hypothetical protein
MWKREVITEFGFVVRTAGVPPDTAGCLLLQIGDGAPNVPLRNRWPFFFHQGPTNRRDCGSAIIAKMLPKNGERISAWERMVIT